MNLFARLFRFIWAVLWYSFAVTTVLVAAAFGVARLLLPMASQYSADIERKVSEYAGQPVKVQGLDAEWHGFGPSLVLKGVRVLDSRGGKTIIQLSKVGLGLDILDSLTRRQITFSSLSVSGANLSLVRYEDGRIALSDFDLQSRSDEDVASENFISRWVMGQGLLSVELKNLFFEDRMGKGRMLHLSNVTVMLRNAGSRHLVDAIVSLPKEPERKFALSLKIDGNPLQGNGWRAEFYTTGHRINFGQLFGVQKVGDYYTSLGESDFEYWGNLSNGQLENLKGEFVLQNLWVSTHAPTRSDKGQIGDTSMLTRIANNKSQQGSVLYDQLTGRVQWRADADGWHLKGDRVVVARDGWLWPASAFEVDVHTTEQQKTWVKANASFVRLQDVLVLQELFKEKQSLGNTNTNAAQTSDESEQQASSSEHMESALQALSHLSPTGDVSDLNLVWHQDHPEDFVLHAALDKAGLNAWGKIPGARGIKATINAGNDGGQIRFDTGKALFNMPSLFRNEHEINQLQGQVRWSYSDDAWTITSDDLVLNTRDVYSQVSFELELPSDDRSPFLNLIGKFHDGDGSRASQYYPVKIMHSGTVDWLDHAIVDGHVTSGGVVFHGNTRDFPFRHNKGVFEVRFNLEKGVLDYAPQWPRIENINAEVVFHNEGMLITSDSATIFRSGLSNVNVSIPDMGASPMSLVVKGDVAGETQEKLWYLHTSPPLYQRFGKYLDGIHATGSSDLGLDIDFKIGKDLFTADVNGALDIHNNAIKVDPLGTLLTQTNGRMIISPEGLSATSLSSDLLGQPAQLHINTQSTKGKKDERTIAISAIGDFDAQDLSQRYVPAIKDLVNGKAAWKVNVDIPFNNKEQGESTTDKVSTSDTNSAINVTVTSDLKGVESRLPPPLNKDRQRSITLNIESRQFGNKRNVSKVLLGGLLDSILEVNTAEDKPVYRGEVRFGGGPVALPDQSGLRLSGNLNQLNVDVWRSLFAGLDKPAIPTIPTKPTEVGSSCCTWLHSIDLSVDKMLLYGQTLTDMQLSGENANEKLTAQLASKELVGTVVIPANLQNLPIELNLDHWYLTSSSMNSEGAMDPREIPAIKAFCKSVTYKQRKFGSVRLETTRVAEGLRLEQLVVKPKTTTITANGSWLIESGKQKSDFDLQLASTDLGKTMDDFGYIGSIEGGKGTLNANIHWPGPLTDPDLKNLEGHVAMEFNNGRLLEVEAGGAGRRIFGLFSIQTLPRRLILDFSDLFKKGFEFNQIKGDFNITQGDAYTRDFALDGPGVEAHMSGRIGIAAQDYDQKVVVTPRVSDITALLTLLSSEPVLFLVQQLLKNKINEAASFEYHLTGPWENFTLEPVQAATPKNSTDDDFIN